MYLYIKAVVLTCYVLYKKIGVMKPAFSFYTCITIGYILIIYFKWKHQEYFHSVPPISAFTTCQEI